MRHRRMRRKLGVTTDHRTALLRNLAKSLVHHKRIVTTYARAREASAFVDGLVTIAKRGGLHARRLLIAKLGCARTAEQLIDQVLPKFGSRKGGYTRVLKTTVRTGDNAQRALLEFTEVFDAPVYKKKVKKAAAKKEGSVTDTAVAEKKTKKSEEPKTEEKAVDKDPEKKKGFVGNLRKFFKREQ
ncbi:MAG TPA: 50S ribosomal protein L17 [Candidatus Omnitrophica bacterium]|nr:50S ribosomal protein L17 [Candidatus Omnitrophota bacterium]